MPRNKTLSPNWCDAAPNQDPEEFELDAADARRLADLLGIDDPTAFKTFCRDLEVLGNDHNEARQVYETGPTQGERNKELAGLIKALEKTNDLFRNVSFATRDAFDEGLSIHPYRQNGRTTKECGGVQLQELEHRTEHTLRGLKQHLDKLRRASRGPAPFNATDASLPRVIEIYEEFSGKRFTHTSIKNGRYTSKPLSDGGIFVLEVLKVIDPDNTYDNQVATAIEKHLKVKRRRRKKSNTPN